MKQEVLEGDLKESPGFSRGEKSMLSITTGQAPWFVLHPKSSAEAPAFRRGEESNRAEHREEEQHVHAGNGEGYYFRQG